MIIVLPTKTSGEKSFISENSDSCNFFYVYNTELNKGEVYINNYENILDESADKLIVFLNSQKTEILIGPKLEKRVIKLLHSEGINTFESTDKIVQSNLESYINESLANQN